MYILFALCTLLVTLEVVTCFIDTSNYKSLVDQKEGNVTFWDAKCTDLGVNWTRAVMEMESEAYVLDDVVRHSHRNRSIYLIGGSTMRRIGRKMKWTQYRTDTNGRHVVYLVLGFTSGKLNPYHTVPSAEFARVVCERPQNVNCLELEFASTTSRYRKLIVGNDSDAKTYDQWAASCSAISGGGWDPAGINSQREYNFIMEAQKSLCNSDSYWIHGSTDMAVGTTIAFSGYNFLNSGANGVMVSTYRMIEDNHHESIELNDKNTFNLQAQNHSHPLKGILCEQIKNTVVANEFASGTSNYKKLFVNAGTFLNLKTDCTDIGSGWEPAEIESEHEFHFIEENLRTDQNTDYFIGGSIYNDTFFDLIYPVWGHHPYQFVSYSPRTSVRPLFLSWETFTDHLTNASVVHLSFIETLTSTTKTDILCEKEYPPTNISRCPCVAD